MRPKHIGVEQRQASIVQRVPRLAFEHYQREAFGRHHGHFYQVPQQIGDEKGGDTPAPLPAEERPACLLHLGKEEVARDEEECRHSDVGDDMAAQDAQDVIEVD